MSKRFYWIERADELKKAKTEYETWQQKSRAEKSAAYKAQLAKTGNKRNAFIQQTGYVKPFAVQAADEVYIEAKVIKAGATASNANEEAPGAIATDLAAAIVAEDQTKYITTTKPAEVGTVIFKPQKISEYARVTLSEKDPGSTVEDLTSRITGMPYRYVKRDSCGTIFGQKLTGTETYAAAKIALKTALAAAATRSISFRAEADITITTA